MESKMKRKTIIYGMVGGVGPVGSAPQYNPDSIDPQLQKESDHVKKVAVFPMDTEGQKPKPLTGDRVTEGDPSKT